MSIKIPLPIFCQNCSRSFNSVNSVIILLFYNRFQKQQFQRQPNRCPSAQFLLPPTIYDLQFYIWVTLICLIIIVCTSNMLGMMLEGTKFKIKTPRTRRSKVIYFLQFSPKRGHMFANLMENLSPTPDSKTNQNQSYSKFPPNPHGVLVTPGESLQIQVLELKGELNNQGELSVRWLLRQGRKEEERHNYPYFIQEKNLRANLIQGLSCFLSLFIIFYINNRHMGKHGHLKSKLPLIDDEGKSLKARLAFIFKKRAIFRLGHTKTAGEVEYLKQGIDQVKIDLFPAL